jgi:hypothetical protein
MGDTQHYTTLACAYLGITMAQVINPRIEGTELVLIYDMGGKGCPKTRIPLKALDALDDPELDGPEPEVLEVEINATDGALRLMRQRHIDADDVLDFLGEDRRLTARDVRRYMKEAE